MERKKVEDSKCSKQTNQKKKRERERNHLPAILHLQSNLILLRNICHYHSHFPGIEADTNKI